MKNGLFHVCALSALMLISLSQAKNYYLSPDGNDINDGLSVETAKYSLRYVADSVSPGDTIIMKGGTYYYDTTVFLTKSGTADSVIYIMAATGEKPVLNYSGFEVHENEDIRAIARGIRLTGDYWYLKGLEICYAPDNGVKCEGSHNTFELCIFFHNNDAGIQIGFWKEGTLVDNSSGELCAYNYVLNCDSYMNADTIYYGKHGGSAYENADGFACKLYPGKGNIFRGCRAWYNCDDGWDFYMTQFEIRVENCWSYHNGDQSLWNQDSSSWNGDGNGFKLGGDDLASPNVAINCVAFDAYFGAKCGFNSNNNAAGITLYNCTAWHCGKNFKMVDQPHILKNCLAFDPVSGKNFNADLTDSLVIQSNNSWNLSGVTPDYSDLASTSAADFIADRQDDGSLPDNGFARLAAGSDCIDKGVDVGLTYYGSAPDLGAYEYDTGAAITGIKNSSLTTTYNGATIAYIINIAGRRVGIIPDYKNMYENMQNIGSGVYYVVRPEASGSSMMKIGNAYKRTR
jgi:pectate disaccharide-lyase